MLSKNTNVGGIAACVADIAFVIDNSGSIRDNDPPGGNNWQLIIDFVKSIIEILTIAPDAIRIAVVDFGMITAFLCILKDSASI